LIKEMVQGLEGESSLAMIPSFVTKLPTGKEIGNAYGLDVGGSNLRVLKIKLDGSGGISSSSEDVLKQAIPTEVQQGNGDVLFDLLADSVKQLTLSGSLGFTFSFPVQQTSIKSGLLMKWTKGFTASGVIGEDLCALLNKSMNKINLNIQVDALINDTVGTQIAGAYQYPDAFCLVGLILGTGSNTCYWENISKMKKYLSKHGIDQESVKDQGMVVNMESGNFGSTRRGVDLPLTEYDEILDKQSHNATHQLLEKQISGMYIGEIVRLICKKYMHDKLLFPNFQQKLSDEYKLETNTVSEIVGDNSQDLDLVKAELKAHGILDSTLEERKFVKKICFLVGYRAATLSSIQILAILKHTSREHEKVIIAIDGSVYEKFTGFKQNMENCLNTFLTGHKITLQHVKDGSGIGAALAAFVNQVK